MKSQKQLERLLDLIPYLQSHPGISVTEAAKEFQITPKQLITELKLVFLCGLPGGMPDDLIDIDMDAVEKDGIIFLSNADYLTRPIKFRQSQAASLIVALRAVSSLANRESVDVVSAILNKLTALDEENHTFNMEMPSVDTELRALLENAIKEKQRIKFFYHGSSRGEISCPEVDPYKLTTLDENIYLEAWSLERNAWRSYRLDRINDVTLLKIKAENHGTPPDNDWFNDSIEHLRLLISPQAEWITEYYPCQDLVNTAEGLEASFPIIDLAWAVNLVLRFGDQIKVLSPVVVTEKAQQRAEAALKIYGF